jgi:aryl-alcohol dehydrogenase-like predicted oxidoreductase
LGHGFLTGEIRSADDLSDDDWRKTNPRFIGENFQRNLRIVARVEENTAADGIVLSTEQIERLYNLTPAVGERHDEANMAAIDR